MAYQVLARKWRSRNFAQVVGQEHVVRALTNALQTDRLHHAYLFTGTRGVGKTSIARILAKSLNCETGVTDTPCGQCQACLQIDSGRFVDLLEIDAASNTGIDNIREVLENAQYAPTSGRFKVYIIDEVHMLSKSAFNAMLKTLEEPPPHVKFILATTDPQKVPVTVLSRCLQFNLKQIPPQVVAEHLAFVLGQENIVFEDGALKQIGFAAQGSMRDALSLLDQAIAYGMGTVTADAVQGMLGTVDQSYLLRLLGSLAENNGLTLLQEADAMATRSISFDQALQALALLLHQIALAQTVPAALDKSTPDYSAIMDLAGRIPPAHIQLYYQIAIHSRKDLDLAPDEYAGFTMALMRMFAFKPSATLPAGNVASTPVPTVVVAEPTPAKQVVRPEPDDRSAPTPVARQTPEPAPVATPPWEDAPPVAESAQEVAPTAPIIAEAEAAPAPVAEEPVIQEQVVEEPVALPVDMTPPAAATAEVHAQQTSQPEWQQVVYELGLSGMAAMLAKHMTLDSVDNGLWSFKLPSNQQPLLIQQDKLKDALSQWSGQPVTLKIVLGASEGPAPIQLEQQARQEEMANATEAILTDPVVQYLQEHAGARLLQDSVIPMAEQPSA
ncbi:DNA polymerase III subunit gamma/tau [Leeia oryzae]|uniref:DNA polymerase III subunit gamma/tau n=1 Tax=Leeia oryzae TaxID=356662 RepID=UPI0004769969|nr:DNA polymerase III subunit gamma/tau [Leeia oryzae]